MCHKCKVCFSVLLLSWGARCHSFLYKCPFAAASFRFGTNEIKCSNVYNALTDGNVLQYLLQFVSLFHPSSASLHFFVFFKTSKCAWDDDPRFFLIFFVVFVHFGQTFRRRTFLFLLRIWHLIIIAQNLVPEWLMCLQWQTGERCKLQKPVRNVKTTNSAKLHIANRKHDLVLLFIIICSTYQQPNVGHIIFVIIGEMVRLSVYQSIGSRFLLRSNWMRLWKVSNYCFLRCDYSPPAIAEIWINISAGVDKQKQRRKKLWKSYDIIKLPTNDGRKKNEQRKRM